MAQIADYFVTFCTPIFRFQRQAKRIIETQKLASAVSGGRVTKFDKAAIRRLLANLRDAFKRFEIVGGRVFAEQDRQS